MARRLARDYDTAGGLRRPPCPLGINLGKTKAVALEAALDDYLASINALAAYADYLVVNVSSPNTPGLRDLQSEAALHLLLAGVAAELKRVAPNTPLFLKIAPDLSPEGVDAAVDVALEEGCHGLICTNTTISRPKLATPWLRIDGIGAGGLSGAPVKALEHRHPRPGGQAHPGQGAVDRRRWHRNCRRCLENLPRRPPRANVHRLCLRRPGVVRRIHHGLLGLLKRNGLSQLSQAVGRDLLQLLPALKFCFRAVLVCLTMSHAPVNGQASPVFTELPFMMLGAWHDERRNSR